MNNDQKIKTEVTQSKDYMQVKIDKMELELQDSREELLRSKEQINNLKFELQ